MSDLNEKMVPVFRSSDHNGEMEAITIQGILESVGIPVSTTGSHVLPSLDFEVLVPESRLAEARQAIQDAVAAGPSAAAEAEAESEA